MRAGRRRGLEGREPRTELGALLGIDVQEVEAETATGIAGAETCDHPRDLRGDQHVRPEPRHAEREQHLISDPHLGIALEQRSGRGEIEQALAELLEAIPVERSAAGAVVTSHAAATPGGRQIVHASMLVGLRRASKKSAIRPSSRSAASSVASENGFSIRRLGTRARDRRGAETIGKPCAGKPHAPFERGSCTHCRPRPVVR
jgi:hypothetical protein